MLKADGWPQEKETENLQKQVLKIKKKT